MGLEINSNIFPATKRVGTGRNSIAVGNPSDPLHPQAALTRGPMGAMICCGRCKLCSLERHALSYNARLLSASTAIRNDHSERIPQ